jgi:hypothetical protein
MMKGQSRPRTLRGGGESRSGMNPEAVGSTPAADTISFFARGRAVLLIGQNDGFGMRGGLTRRWSGALGN